MHIFDNDNFSIIPKSIFFDNDNLQISCKNADISAIDNFFDNIAQPSAQERGERRGLRKRHERRKGVRAAAD